MSENSKFFILEKEYLLSALKAGNFKAYGKEFIEHSRLRTG